MAKMAELYACSNDGRDVSLEAKKRLEHRVPEMSQQLGQRCVHELQSFLRACERCLQAAEEWLRYAGDMLQAAAACAAEHLAGVWAST